MYQPLLFLHSWTRWIVVISAVYFFLRAVYGVIKKDKPAAADHHFLWAFRQVVWYQALFGAAIWLGASPFVKAAFANRDSIFENGLVSFWLLRHPLTMISAIAIIEWGRGKARKTAAEKRFLIHSFPFGSFLLLIASAIPWPFLENGRPLFRSF